MAHTPKNTIKLMLFAVQGVLSTVLQTSLLQWLSMGQMLFGLQGDFSLQHREWPLGKIGCKAEWWHPIQLLLYIHGCHPLVHRLPF